MGDAGTTHPIERLGIPAIVLIGGPVGIRIDDHSCTKFPIGSSLASTWNPQMVEEVVAAIVPQSRRGKNRAPEKQR